MTKSSARIALVVVLVGGAIHLAPARADDAADAAAAADKTGSEKLTQTVRQSVVAIYAATRDSQRDSLGTGFVIAPDGLIATNYHVIGDGRAIRVQLADGRTFEPQAIQATDRALDLALVKIDAANLHPLPLGDSTSLQQGQSVLAFGNPQGLKLSVVAGVVSGMREVDGRSMIQLAMPIEQGNSGGPLVDLNGRVQGIVTMKSAVTANLGFAVAIDSLKPLVARPNPVPMSRWLTIGALDAREWQPLLGGHWQQRAGRITVDGQGEGFGGRALCLCQQDVPERPYELAVCVRLADESGAAGLAFCCDGGQQHYGFYATGGRLRLTRFEGPSVQQWNILLDLPSRVYVPGGWNTLRVRMEDQTLVCFVNDQLIGSVTDRTFTGGKAGLIKFRDTKATFKDFSLGKEVATLAGAPDEVARIARLVEELPPKGPLDPQLVEKLAGDTTAAARILRQRAARLDAQAAQLRRLADAAHHRRVIGQLCETLTGDEQKIDLVRAALLVARLDNDEVDVDQYAREFERLADELKSTIDRQPDESQRLAALHKFLFEQNGFHGSRADFENRANSYLNEVLDDREGLPITLAIVYLELARRIDLHVEGVPLPGHFVVRVNTSDGQEKLIDVFEQGAAITRESANQKVKENLDRDITPAEWRAATKRSIITRMLHNLLGVSGPEPLVMQHYLDAILALDPTSAAHRWMRAVVAYRLEDRALALVDVDWLTQHHPPGIDAARVAELKRAIETLP